MRRWLAAAAVPLALLAGCGQGGAGGAPPAGSGNADFDRRAAEVAAAWRASGADAAWRDGFVPLGELTVLTQDAGFSADTKLAYSNGWFRSTTQLSTKAPSGGSIRFGDGTALSVELISAADAYRAIDQGDPPCGREGGVPPAVQQPQPDSRPPLKKDPLPSTAVPGECTALTVTGVRLGTVQLWTNRGEAPVPAWLFTVDEIAGPVARVAVAPSAIGTLPDPMPPPVQPGVRAIVGADDLSTVDGETLSYEVGVGACDSDISPLAYEADDIVVIGGQVGARSSGPCIAIGLSKPVTVTLDAPVGNRVVLDVDTGRPVLVNR